MARWVEALKQLTVDANGKHPGEDGFNAVATKTYGTLTPSCAASRRSSGCGASAVAEAGLETLWDEREGFYYNRRTDTGAFSRRISPCNFYALFSEKITADRVHRMVDGHYFNPEEFYGAWMIPSIARNDAAFQDQDYWRGRIWAPLNFLVYMAMLEHDVPDARKDLADKSVALYREGVASSSLLNRRMKYLALEKPQHMETSSTVMEEVLSSSLAFFMRSRLIWEKMVSPVVCLNLCDRYWGL